MISILHTRYLSNIKEIFILLVNYYFQIEWIITKVTKILHSIYALYFDRRIYGQTELITATPLDTRTNLQTDGYDARFAICVQRRIQWEGGPGLLPSSSLRLSTRVFIFPACLAWKTSKTVPGIAADLSQPYPPFPLPPPSHRSRCCSSRCLPHPPSRDARSINQRNLRGCHEWWQPCVMSRPSALWLI